MALASTETFQSFLSLVCFPHLIVNAISPSLTLPEHSIHALCTFLSSPSLLKRQSSSPKKGGKKKKCFSLYRRSCVQGKYIGEYCHVTKEKLWVTYSSSSLLNCLNSTKDRRRRNRLITIKKKHAHTRSLFSFEYIYINSRYDD
jgi:hypothetical protein